MSKEKAKDTLKVRVATPEDLPAIMEILMLACEENGFLNPNPMKMAAEIWPALHLDHGICAVIGEPNKKIEGLGLLRIGNMWYSDSIVVEEKAIFIHPDFRHAKGGRATRLCQFSKRVADELKIPLIIGVLSNHRTEGKVRMYERQFGKPSGAFFLYGAETGKWQGMEH
jgi:hypothetical protein